MNIKNKVAIVTGGASGLGEATTRNIVANGGKVLIMDLNMDRGKSIVAELGKDKVIFDKTDVTSESQVKEALARAVREFGKVDICVNCAGIGVAKKTVGKEGAHDLGSFEKVIKINLSPCIEEIASLPGSTLTMFACLLLYRYVYNSIYVKSETDSKSGPKSQE